MGCLLPCTYLEYKLYSVVLLCFLRPSLDKFAVFTIYSMLSTTCFGSCPGHVVQSTDEATSRQQLLRRFYSLKTFCFVFKKVTPSGVNLSCGTVVASAPPTPPLPPSRAATSASALLLPHITPTPLTGCIMMLVPCRNSSREFILVVGSKCAILTPSLAFLLWGFSKNWVGSILK